MFGSSIASRSRDGNVLTGTSSRKSILLQKASTAYPQPAGMNLFSIANGLSALVHIGGRFYQVFGNI
jgi:hypothetical protein